MTSSELSKVLIYISYKYQVPGTIREEYVNRMQLAITDACRLGVSKRFVENSLYPQMFARQQELGGTEFNLHSINKLISIGHQVRTV